MAIKGHERTRQVPFKPRAGSLPDFHLKNSKLVSISFPSQTLCPFSNRHVLWFELVWKCLTRRSIGSGAHNIPNATKPPLLHWVQFLTTRAQGRSIQGPACPTNCFKRCVSEGRQTKLIRTTCKSRWVKLRARFPFPAKISSYPRWTPNLNWESSRGNKISSNKDQRADNIRFPQICTA